MSNRGWLVTYPGDKPRSKIIAETAHFIPPFWLAFLSPADVAAAEQPGLFRLDRKRAVERGTDLLPFFVSLFPQVRPLRGAAESLVQKLARSRSKTLRIEVTDLLEETEDPARPGLADAVEVIERRDAKATFVVPARTLVSPFTGGEVRRDEVRIANTRDLLLYVCMTDSDFLTSRSKDVVREAVVGHVWP